MIQIDFKSGFQAIQNKGVHYRFAFADLTTEDTPQIQLAAAGIIREFTETDPGEHCATFIRDGSTGDVYAVLMEGRAIHIQKNLKFPEGKEHFLRQFVDWVFIEPDDVIKFKLKFIDSVDGWLPQHWYWITKCLEHPTRPKSKNAIAYKWASRNRVLTFDKKTGLFKLELMLASFEMHPVCAFYPNEIFPQPE